MKVIITGATGMVGKSVLMECLNDDRVNQVLVLTRRSTGLMHPKLKELLHEDFLNFATVAEELAGYDACFHCMGVSAVGKSEADYTRLTYAVTTGLATTLLEQNPGMVFNYVSGTGSDSSEKGRIMWARVKGRTENAILNMGFKDAYAIRLGGLIPSKGIKSRTGWVNTMLVIFSPLFPLMKRMKSITTSEKLGQAMINSLYYPQKGKHLENREINQLASAQP